jgi:hypothetical protein
LLLFPQGGRAANQMRAAARVAPFRCRWSLEFAQKNTILDVCSAEGAEVRIFLDLCQLRASAGKKQVWLCQITLAAGTFLNTRMEFDE